MAVAKVTDISIDELAHSVGMTTRNIRAYQSAGLIPPPRLQGRTGYYAAEHVARLRLIQELQAEGFSLRSIKRLLSGWGGSSQEMLIFKRVLLAPFGDEQPEIVSASLLEERFGTEPSLTRKAEELGLIRYIGEGRYEVPSPRLLRAGEDLVSLGIPLRHVLAVAERIFRHSRAIADSFIQLLLRDVMPDVQKLEAGTDWRGAREALERVRPLAREAVLAGFEQTMTRTVEETFARLIEPQQGHGKAPRETAGRRVARIVRRVSSARARRTA